ncbi:zinc-ribbon domain-containing protein [Flavobacterium sp.]|uniref:zinc-ribbon domain-containing protein n=1 Tax=Flavobacterium sp. TaxID=239 RepID=UPI0028BD1A15|nr:zinc-ribbon domain-containing protein [Flavobacterium sp.]
MIFFGTKKKEIKRGIISNTTCKVCEENTPMYYTVEAKYFHVYWIPVFPYKKNTTVDCSYCDTTFEKKQFSESIKNKLQRENELEPARNPIWMFSGVIILTILIPLAFMQSARADDKKNDFVNHPKVGDVYFMNSLPTIYTTMKIAAVEKDTVHFIANDTMVTKFTKVFSITDNRYYTDKIKSYSKAQILDMYRKDSIYKIDRN